MQRIMIIGCSGSGKSTFSKKLQAATQLPVLHLDQKYWQPNWIEPTKEKWRSIVTKLAAQEKWIMDGNYSDTWDLRIPRAETIIFLDQPTYICFYRVIKRILKHHGKTRPDMTEGCPERFDAQFFHYVLVYNLVRRKANLEKLNSLRGEKQIHIFRKEKEMNAFLENIKSSSSMI